MKRETKRIITKDLSMFIDNSRTKVLAEGKPPFTIMFLPVSSTFRGLPLRPLGSIANFDIFFPYDFTSYCDYCA